MTRPMWSSTRSASSSPRSISTIRRFLGNTIAEIAVEKAGIFKRGAPAVIGLQRDEARTVLDRAARTARRHPLCAGRGFPRLSAQDGRLVYPGRRWPARPAALGPARRASVRQCRARHRRHAPFRPAGRCRRHCARACAVSIWPARHDAASARASCADLLAAGHRTLARWRPQCPWRRARSPRAARHERRTPSATGADHGHDEHPRPRRVPRRPSPAGRRRCS